LLLLSALLCLPISQPAAQQPSKVHKIGHLLVGTPTPQRAQLWDELRRLGYVEGHNLIIERRYWRTEEPADHPREQPTVLGRMETLWSRTRLSSLQARSFRGAESNKPQAAVALLPWPQQPQWRGKSIPGEFSRRCTPSSSVPSSPPSSQIMTPPRLCLRT